MTSSFFDKNQTGISSTTIEGLYTPEYNSNSFGMMTTESTGTINFFDNLQNGSHSVEPLSVGNIEITLEVIWLSCIFLFGISMNLAILFLLMKHPKTRSTASMFITNIAVVDFIQCAYVPVVMYGILLGEWNFMPIMCLASAAWTSIPYCVSFWAHLGLAVCRYCYQNVRSKMCKAMLNKGPVRVIIISMWVLQLVLHWSLVWSHFAPADVMFIREYGMCGIVITDTAYGGYMVVSLSLTLNLLIPFIACLIIYVCVARAVRRQVVAFPSDLAQKMYAEVTKYTTLLFGVFCACWLPEYLRVVFDADSVSPVWFIRLCNSLIFFNSAINPYVYALRCAAIRRAFIKQFPTMATVLKLSDQSQALSTPHENISPVVNQATARQGTAHGDIVISTVS